MSKLKHIMVRGERYVAAVFLVTGRTSNGEPRELRRIANDELVQLQGGEEFIVAFVKERVLRKAN